jgi:hypothetical protein
LPLINSLKFLRNIASDYAFNEACRLIANASGMLVLSGATPEGKKEPAFSRQVADPPICQAGLGYQHT